MMVVTSGSLKAARNSAMRLRMDSLIVGLMGPSLVQKTLTLYPRSFRSSLARSRGAGKASLRRSDGEMKPIVSPFRSARGITGNWDILWKKHMAE